MANEQQFSITVAAQYRLIADLKELGHVETIEFYESGAMQKVTFQARAKRETPIDLGNRKQRTAGNGTTG